MWFGMVGRKTKQQQYSSILKEFCSSGYRHIKWWSSCHYTACFLGSTPALQSQHILECIFDE